MNCIKQSLFLAAGMTIASLLAGCGNSDNADTTSVSEGKESVVTDANFADFTQTKGVALVDFWATWCGPCKQMAPIYAKVSNEYDGKAKFGRLNVDDSPKMTNDLGIRGIPTIVIFQDGKVVDKVVGVVNADNLKRHIDRFVSDEG